MPYPTPEDYTFESGIDPTSVFTTDQATCLLQLIRLAIANSYHGLVIHSTATPQTTGEPTGYPADWYAWNVRNLLHNPTTNELFGYKTGLGWESIPLGTNVVGTAQIIDGSITLAKWAVEGSPYQIPQINGTGTGWVLVDPSGLNPVGTIPIDRLVKTGGPGYLHTDGTTIVYQLINAQDVNTAVQGGNLVHTAISVGDALQVLRTNAAGTETEWVDSGSVPVGSITIDKLAATGGTANQGIRLNGGGTAFQFYTIPAVQSNVQVSSTPAALPASGSTATFAHALGSLPSTWEARFVCVTVNNGYALGDYIDYFTVCTGGSNNEQNAFVLVANATNLTLTQENGTFPNRSFISRDTGAIVSFNSAQWNLIFRATLLSS